MSHFLNYEGLITYTNLLKNYVAQSTSYNENDFDVNTSTSEITIALTIAAVEPSEDNIREEYALVGNDGKAKGETIKVYKNKDVTDLLIKSAGTYYVSADGELVSTETSYGSITIEDDSIVLVLCEDNTSYTIEAVELPKSIEAQYIGDGLLIDDDKVISILIDDSSEDSDGSYQYLSVSSDGLKLDGVNDAINDAIQKETEQRESDIETLNESIADLAETATNHVAREDTTEATDLDIVDPNDNVIVRFVDGQILTAAFNSETVLSLIEEILERLNTLEIKILSV